MKKISLVRADDRCDVRIFKRKQYNSDKEYCYDIDLDLWAQYDPNNPNGIVKVTFSHINGLNHVFEMLGLETLSKEDEQLLTEFIATRGDLGRESVYDDIRSSGTMMFTPGHVAIFGSQNSELGKNSAYDSNGSIEGKDIKEVLANIRQLDSQPE